MRRGRWWSSTAAGGLWLGLATAALAQQPSGPTQAGKQRAMIQSRLHNDPSLQDNHVAVSIDNGVARLTGTVDSEAEKAAAARDATVAGVVGVDNRLVIAGGTLAETVADDALRASIREHLLADQQNRFDHVTVKSQNGVITLSGSVPSDQAVKQAVELARGTAGVSDVQNNLTIAPREQ
jgi:hyperosmotically inducible periplasmic protein